MQRRYKVVIWTWLAAVAWLGVLRVPWTFCYSGQDADLVGKCWTKYGTIFMAPSVTRRVDEYVEGRFSETLRAQKRASLLEDGFHERILTDRVLAIVVITLLTGGVLLIFRELSEPDATATPEAGARYR